MRQSQPWIGHPMTDTLFILLPPFFCLAIIGLFPGYFTKNEVTPFAWLLLVMLVDVGHVYSTLFSTYFDRSAFKQNRTLLLAIPVGSFLCSAILYNIDPMWFWRTLAYIAVFHFIRQQYGFMKVYGRHEKRSKTQDQFEKTVIYSATLFPILHWHLSGPKEFNWFVDGDFFYLPAASISKFATIVYAGLIAVYLLQVLLQYSRHRYFNLPKFLVITGTILSWYMGIVYFNGDLTFTLFNVISHGIPYMALVWIYGQKSYTLGGKGSKFLRFTFSKQGFLVFLLIIFTLAFLEESIWDAAIWKEHRQFFFIAPGNIPELGHQTLSLLIPLLTVPQLTHYILDGFIWRIRNNDFKWKSDQA